MAYKVAYKVAFLKEGGRRVWGDVVAVKNLGFPYYLDNTASKDSTDSGEE